MTRHGTIALGRIAALIGAAAIAGSACAPGGGASQTPTVPAASQPTAASAAATARSATPASPTPVAFARNPAPIVEGTPYTQTIDPANFVAGIDHPFYPLKPGTKFIYGGDEKVEVTVSPDTRMILGVPTTVVRDQVFVDGALEEDTIDWFAQDRQGNVWYFGEKTAEYKDGKVSSTKGSWEAGVNGAVPGIVMLAQPQIGDAYRQEYFAGEAEDLAAVTGLSGSITVPAGSYRDLLVTEEWTPLDTARRERKTYARGVGLVETRTIKGGTEVVVLQKVSG